MAEIKALYRYSLNEAMHNNERDLWRESYKENCNCARAIEKAIADGYDGKSLDADCAKSVIAGYGFDRVNFVLANTIKRNSEDGRFSRENKDWAKTFYIPNDDVRWHFSVEAHPGLTDLVVTQARKAWKELGLFDRSHCISEKDGEIDYTDKVVAIKPEYLKDEFKTPDNQLFLAQTGFGCSANSRGRKVYGQFMTDGEKTYFQRDEIVGVVTDENLPGWVKEKLSEMSDADTEQDEGITMGGM